MSAERTPRLAESFRIGQVFPLIIRGGVGTGSARYVAVGEFTVTFPERLPVGVHRWYVDVPGWDIDGWLRVLDDGSQYLKLGRTQKQPSWPKPDVSGWTLVRTADAAARGDGE